MPILDKEDDIFPEFLLENEEIGGSEGVWSAVYTMSRREKELMRRLRSLEIAFYCPIVANHTKSPAGRERTSYLPLFANYVFIYAGPGQRHEVLKTNCVSQWIDVPDGAGLKRDLRQLRSLILTEVPLTLETCIETGALVYVKSGALQGQQGFVVRQQGANRLIVPLNFLQQGVSVLLGDAEVEPCSVMQALAS